MTPLLLSAYTATTCLGQGVDALRAALRDGRSGLAPCAFETVRLDTWIGEVPAVDAVRLPETLADYDCRNNRLTLLGLEADGFADRVRAAIARHGRDRVGVFLGTSTAGILQTELAYRRRDPQTGELPADFIYRTTHNSFSLAEFTRAYFGLEGIAMAISTACSSSAKVFAAAARQLALGSIDAAVVGGQLLAQRVAVVAVGPGGGEYRGQRRGVGAGCGDCFHAGGQRQLDDAAGAPPFGGRQHGRCRQHGRFGDPRPFAAQHGQRRRPVGQAGAEAADAVDPGGQRGAHAAAPKTSALLLPPKPKELDSARRGVPARACSR